jgi:hypothetical protein
MINTVARSRGSSTWTMLLFLMTMVSTGLMYYYFQRSRHAERYVLAWEAFRDNRGDLPPRYDGWGRATLSKVGSALEGVMPSGLMAKEPMRPAEKAEELAAEARARNKLAERARHVATEQLDQARSTPLEWRVASGIGRAVGTAVQRATEAAAPIVVETVAEQLSEAARGLAPEAMENPLNPASTTVPQRLAISGTRHEGMVLAPVEGLKAEVRDGVRRDPGPGAGVQELAPLTDTIAENGSPAAARATHPVDMELVSAASIEASPTPAPRRAARIRSVYDLEEGAREPASGVAQSPQRVRSVQGQPASRGSGRAANGEVSDQAQQRSSVRQ